MREEAGVRELTVTGIGGDRHRVSVRGHQLLVDQPVDAGGTDAGPTPVELFVASLASCVAHYARRALGRDGGSPTVHCHWTMSYTPPWRVSSIDIDVVAPAGTASARLDAVRRAVTHCTVHNTLQDPPTVRIEAAVDDAQWHRAA
ncbi:MAG TPA: OsmC family protein [Candidatus Acidoferrales bacterium]|jgi:putative redox protein|nr:OsmC family protein [Candidatus Acidoferrales bacterium]